MEINLEKIDIDKIEEIDKTLQIIDFDLIEEQLIENIKEFIISSLINRIPNNFKFIISKDKKLLKEELLKEIKKSLFISFINKKEALQTNKLNLEKLKLKTQIFFRIKDTQIVSLLLDLEYGLSGKYLGMKIMDEFIEQINIYNKNKLKEINKEV